MTSSGASESGSDPTEDPTGGASGVQVVVPEAVSLCANSHLSTTVPEAFALNARLEITAGEHHLGPRVTWPAGQDGLPQGPPPTGEDIALNATLRFPNTDAGMHAFGGGNWAAVQDRDVWGDDAPGLVWMSPAKAPTSESAHSTGSATRSPASVSEVRRSRSTTIPRIGCDSPEATRGGVR